MWIVPPMSGSATPVFHQVRGSCFYIVYGGKGFFGGGTIYRSITTSQEQCHNILSHFLITFKLKKILEYYLLKAE